MNREAIKDHKDLGIYKISFSAAMQIFDLSKTFPVEERFALTDQVRRSDARRLANASLSRSVCANLAEAWRKRRYEAAFIAKLNDCEAEAAETQTWVEQCLSNVAI